MKEQNKANYWKTSRKYILIISSMALLIALVIPILLFDQLNEIKFLGFPLGFWFGMQGSQIILCALLFSYAFLMNRLDHKHGFQ
ncbi:MAG: putative solute:sodium symporter small subunit [Saprospiraceae bacterium]|jgi:putative solute:sodium symporter small subunit